MAVLKGEEPTQAFPWMREVKSSSPNIACQRALPVTQRSSSWPADDTSSTAAELIFDIDIVDDDADYETSEARRAAALSPLDETRVKYQTDQLAYLTCPSSPFQYQLMRDVRAYKLQCAGQGVSCDHKGLAECLATLGYNVRVRECSASSIADCLRNLRHTFLCVSDSTHYIFEEVIVEPYMREQFLVAHPTAAFAKVLESLPEEFIGSKARLASVVDVLCTEMSISFKAHGHVVPPWRQMRGMLSKWFPECSKDTIVESPPESPGHNSSFSGQCVVARRQQTAGDEKRIAWPDTCSGLWALSAC